LLKNDCTGGADFLRSSVFCCVLDCLFCLFSPAGNGAYGRLGHGEEADIDVATRIDSLLATGSCVQISCGAFHTVVLLKNGHLYGFGSNLFGQLGQGGNDGNYGGSSGVRSTRVKNFLEPAKIISKASKRYHQVACGTHHTLALTSTNRLVTWGYVGFLVSVYMLMRFILLRLDTATT